ncbi:MAG: hypothetical protein FJ026_09695 [Chloroflexi bacterium]|nr:hypothetical protein [Chloroflexota bacterium]
MRETYGIGDSAAARENRARLDQLLRQREAAMVADENAQVDAGYEDAVRQDRQAAVYGGGVHSQERRAGRNLAGLIGGRQQARAVGRNATNQGMQALEQDLATQESAFLGRAVAPDSYFDAQQQHMNLQAASGNVGLQTVGNALNQGAQLVMTDANAKANDRRGIF